MKVCPKKWGLMDYFTGTYLSTSFPQVFHNPLFQAGIDVLIIRTILLHLYT